MLCSAKLTHDDCPANASKYARTTKPNCASVTALSRVAWLRGLSSKCKFGEVRNRSARNRVRSWISVISPSPRIIWALIFHQSNSASVREILARSDYTVGSTGGIKVNALAITRLLFTLLVSHGGSGVRGSAAGGSVDRFMWGNSLRFVLLLWLPVRGYGFRARGWC